MRQEYEFVVPGLPAPYTRMVRGDQSRRAAEYRAYKELVGRTAREAGVEPIDGPVMLTVHVYIPDRMKRRWDADNVLKGCSDALNGIAYADDKQVTSAHVRVYSLQAFFPRDGSQRLRGDRVEEVRIWIQKSTCEVERMRAVCE